MAIDVTKESLCINKSLGQKKSIITVEEDIIVPDVKPDILSVIQEFASVCIYKREAMENKIRLDGDVKLYIMYLADDSNGNIRSLNSSIDFNEVLEFENVKPNMSIDEDVIIKNVECRVLNGRKINVKVTLEVNMKVYVVEDIEIINELTSIRDVQMLKEDIIIQSLVGEGTSKVIAKETIELEEGASLADILCFEENVINKDIKISYNKVLAKAELIIKIVYLTEDNQIKIKTEQIPLMGFIDIPSILDTNICDVKYKRKNILIKPNNIENNIYVEIEYELYCRVYNNQNLELINDLYSPSLNLEYNCKKIDVIADKKMIIEKYNIVEQLKIPELIDNKLYNVSIKPKIISSDIRNSKILYQGEVELSLIFSSNNSASVDVKQIAIPFKFDVISENINKDTKIDVRNRNIKTGI